MDNKIERIKELVSITSNASNAYYNTDKPIIEDVEFDKLFDELKQLETETGFIMSQSVTQKVGFEIKSKLTKVTHSIPLKSLGKTKSVDEVNSFINNKDVLAMLKGDGLTCELIYDDGLFVQGSSRGDSIIGEEITHNVKTFKNIPLHIKFKGHLKLAGEAVIFDKDFQAMNSKLSEEDKYSNSRNLVAGSVRQLNSSICAKRNVNFMAFSLLECEGKEFKTLSEQFDFLGSLGFQIISHIKYIPERSDLETCISNLKTFAYEGGIPIDGIVFAFNNIEYAKSLGETMHHPLGKIAYKFANEEYETKYIRTEWSVSRTSIINPIGVFEPVNVDNAMISRATLHNIDYFEALQLGKGDLISIARQNEVIPKILSNSTKSNTEKIPDICPICGGKTEIRLQKTARFLYCLNDSCPSKKVAQISHFCSRNAMNIIGVSDAVIEKFIDKGFIKTIVDLYKLEQYENQIVNMDGYGQKSYDRIIEGINNSKQCKLENLLYGIGIENVGKGTSRDVAKFVDDDIERLMNITYDELLSMKDCGEVTALSISNYFKDLTHQEQIKELLKYIKIDKEENIMADTTLKDLTGVTFVITGAVHTFKNRDEFKELVSSLNGKTVGSVSKKTDYLVSNESSTTSKYMKATALGVPVLTEMEFNEMIGRIINED